MNIKNKHISLLNYLISGICIIVFGIIVIIGSINMYTRVINLLVYIFILYGLSKLLGFILNKKIVRNKHTLITIILNIILGVVLLIFPKVSLSLLPLIFSIYLLINSMINFIDYIILRENKLFLRYKYLFFSLFFFIISLIFLFYPIEKLNLFILIIGVYCLLLGVNIIVEFFMNILSDKFKLELKHKIKMTLPVFLEALVPKAALKKINKYLDMLIEDNENTIETDLQILIHLSNYGYNQFGHVEICFEGNIYSYGSYDYKTKKFFKTIGDGVLYILDKKKKYIDFCIVNNNKTIVEYGVLLTSKEKEKLKLELEKIIEDTYKWNPIKEGYGEKYYSYKLYKATKCKFYKFKKGNFKTYFIMGANCSYFVDQLLNNNVVSILKIAGIITPGTYYNFLEENYKRKNSNIVFKKIYNKDTLGDNDVKNKK